MKCFAALYYVFVIMPIYYYRKLSGSSVFAARFHELEDTIWTSDPSKRPIKRQ